ncbi:MAG: P-loop NTPase fold protein [Dehalococcoidia bacterium]
MLLRDDPLANLAEEDQFRHTAYEHVLRRILGDVTPPFTIGLFGKWGTGKSTITNHLAKAYRHKRGENDSAAVVLDVWKFQSDSFRRQFLLGVEEQLVEQKVITKPTIRSALDKQVGGIDGDQPISIDLHALALTSGIALATALAIGVGLFLLFRWRGVDNPEVSFLVLVLVPLLIQVLARVPNVVVRPSSTTLAPVTSDRFEALFKDEIVEKVRARRIDKVIAIVDNLDRLQSSQVIEVLGSIKTYLEHQDSPFMFVIPCDDVALRSHIEAEYARDATSSSEFLRKFFNVTIDIADFYEDELYQFARRELMTLRLTEGEEPEVVERLARMTSFAFSESPRRVKQFINNLAARTQLAEARVDQGILNLGKEKFATLIAAKLMIVDERWPVLYEQMGDEPGVLWDLQIGATQGVEDPRLDSEERAGLREFLLATEDVVATNGQTRAYMRLKQNEAEARLPDYEEFRRYLEMGDVDAAGKCVLSDTALVDARWSIMLLILRELARSTQIGQARNVLSVIVILAEEAEEERRRRIADSIGPVLTQYRVLAGQPGRLPIGSLLDVLDASPQQRIRLEETVERTIAALTDDSEDELAEELAEELVEDLADRIAMLPGAQVPALGRVIEDRFKTRSGVLLCATKTKDATGALMTPTTIDNYISSLTVDDFLPHEGGELPPAVELLRRFDPVMEPPSANGTIGKLTELLNATDPGKQKELRTMCDLLEGIPESIEQADASLVDGLLAALEARLAGSEEALARHVLHAELVLAHGSSSEAAVQGASDNLSQFLGTAEAETVREFVRAETKRPNHGLSSASWLEPLTSRLRETRDEEACQMIAEAIWTAGENLGSREEAVAAVGSVLHQAAVPSWRAAFAGVHGLLSNRSVFRTSKRNVEVVEALFSAACKGIAASPSTADSHTVGLLRSMARAWKISHDPLLEVLTASARARNDGAASFVDSFAVAEANEQVLTDEEARSWAGATQQALRETPPVTERQFHSLVNALVLVAPRLTQRDSVYRVVRDYSRPDSLRPAELPSALRPAAYAQLGTMGFVPREDARREVGDLLQEAKAAEEPLRSQIMDALADLRSAKVLPGSKKWAEVRDFAGGLGPSYARIASRL